MVGGSWRALARLDMALTDYPLPITHQYRMAPDAAAPSCSAPIAALEQGATRRASPSLSASRMPDPAATPTCCSRRWSTRCEPSELIVSSFGIREGLLYDELDAETRALDPLIEAAREAGGGLGRFAEHGDLLDRWIAPMFDDTPALRPAPPRRLPARRHRLGRPIPISAPSAASTWRCTAIGWRSTRRAG